MKIISSFMDDLKIKKGKLHTIAFESSYTLSEFRSLIQSCFQTRKKEKTNYLKILNSNGNQIKPTDFFFISFDCNVISLQEEKNTVKTLKDVLLYYLENNEYFLEHYLKFNESLNVFASNLELTSNNISIEMKPTEKTIERLIQSFDISFEYKDNDCVPNFILRDFLIKSILQMNILQKEPFLLLSYPETDLGISDYETFIGLLRALQITTVVITSNRDILTMPKENKVFLVNQNGELYDIINLHRELKTFSLTNKNSEEIAKYLAYYDFKKDYTLLDKKYVKFLKSNRF